MARFERGAARETKPAAALRYEAETVTGGLPALLAKSNRLAATVVLGAHGRRRAGVGETFWQYRQALPGDPAQMIDWRRSARSDTLYIRETEWEAAQTVWLWCDRSQSMGYRSARGLIAKVERTVVLGAALAVLLTRGGERIAGLGTDAARPRSGERQLQRIVTSYAKMGAEEWGAPPTFEAARGGRVVFISDFFGDEDVLLQAVTTASSQGLSGFILQVVDPAEEAFPFGGRVVFESMARTLSYETERADAIRGAYQAALARRRDRLQEAARRSGWRMMVHRTDQPASPALLWLVQGLSDARGDAHAY